MCERRYSVEEITAFFDDLAKTGCHDLLEVCLALLNSVDDVKATWGLTIMIGENLADWIREHA